MKEAIQNFAEPVRWSLFALALPLSGFISLMGWVGTGFGGLADSLPLLLVFPVVLIALRSFRIAATGLISLLSIQLLLPFRFGWHRLTLEDLAGSRLDLLFWAVVLTMSVAAFAIPSQKLDSQTELS